MAILTILSDWRSPNYYFAYVAGKLHSALAQPTLIELSPPLDAHKLSQAAFILKNALPAFPENTIHGVFVGMPTDRHHICIGKINNQYVVTWNTGLLSLLCEPNELEYCLVEIENQDNAQSWLNPITEVMIQLANDKPFDFTHSPLENTLHTLQPVLQANYILGNVIHIDTYGNVISNITKALFLKTQNKRRFEIYVQSKANMVNRISANYEPEYMGELIALFNDINHLELAISHERISDLLNLDTSSEIKVVFFED